MKGKKRPPTIKLADIWAFYDGYNKSVNEIARQISYAGIALIWVFRTTVGNHIQIPKALFNAGFFLVLCLFLDFLQSVIGSVSYQIYGSYKEARIADGDGFQQPRWLLWPMDILFFLKIISVLAGYIVIMSYLIASFS